MTTFVTKMGRGKLNTTDSAVSVTSKGGDC